MKSINQLVNEELADNIDDARRWFRNVKVAAGQGNIKDHLSQAKDATKTLVKTGLDKVNNYDRRNPGFTKGAAFATGLIGTGFMGKSLLSKKKQ